MRGAFSASLAFCGAMGAVQRAGVRRSVDSVRDSVVATAGEKVFAPLRLSFIVPCNLVLDTLMMSGALAAGPARAAAAVSSALSVADEVRVPAVAC